MISKLFSKYTPTFYQPLIKRCFSDSAAIDGILQRNDRHIEVPLIEKKYISQDTAIFRFELPDKNIPLGLQCGQHLTLTKKYMGPEREELVQRRYTPISSYDQLGYLDMLVKIYYPLPPKFPKGGEMSQVMDKMEIGDTIEIEGPDGFIIYHGDGNFQLRQRHLKFTDVGFIIGGTGITPAYQVLKKIFDNKSDPTRAHLLFGNKSEDDILLRKELEEFGTDKRFNIQFIIDESKDISTWKGKTGFINDQIFKDTFPKPSDDLLLTFCGPPGMKKVTMNLIDELGYEDYELGLF